MSNKKNDLLYAVFSAPTRRTFVSNGEREEEEEEEGGRRR